MKSIIVYSIVISVCISAFAFMLVLAQPQTMPAYAPVNTNAFNPWAASQPQLQNYIPQASYAPNMPNNMMNAPNNFVNVPNNLAFPTNPNINPMINNPNLMNPNTNPNMMIPNNNPNMMIPNSNPNMMIPNSNPNMMIPNSNPQFQYSGQPQINPMQQPVANGFSYNAPSNEYITQQFRAPSRPQRPQFSFPQFGTNAISGPSISSSAPSFPQMDPSILNSMADTIAPSLSRGAATLESIPSTIMSQAQDQLAQSAAAAGMSTEQAQGIIQEAMQRGASILTPPRPKPSSCDKADFECQFYSACYSCYANRNQPQCMYCLNLDNCAGDLACQTQRACPVCQRLPKTETRPGACDILKC